MEPARYWLRLAEDEGVLVGGGDEQLVLCPEVLQLEVTVLL